jgi:signal transduction histidine kinase
LESFYIKNSKDDLSDLYKEINSLDQTQYTPDNLYQLSIQRQAVMEIEIIDLEKNITYTSLNPRFNSGDNNVPHGEDHKPPMDDFEYVNSQTIDENSKYVWFIEKKFNATFLAYEGILDNGLSINIRMPLAPVKQTILFFNQYLLIIGIILFIITIIAANIISKHFTGPILNIFKVTNSIKKLDFSNTCQVETNDEIGRLSQNINEMSITLKEEIEQHVKVEEQRKTLLNNVSHELKTPLSLVQGYSEGLKINLHKDKEKIDFYCDVIIDEARKMDLIVSQLLDINRMQFGDFPLHKEFINGKEFLSNIIKKYSTLIVDNSIIFNTNLDSMDNSLKLNIDTLRCEQVLTNLLNNALAYVDELKKITFCVDESEYKSGHIRIIVSNSHEELPEEELEMLWNSFYKIDKARTRENGGYGLGLSIIKAIQETDSNEYGIYQQDGIISFWIDVDIE